MVQTQEAKSVRVVTLRHSSWHTLQAKAVHRHFVLWPQRVTSQSPCLPAQSSPCALPQSMVLRVHSPQPRVI